MKRTILTIAIIAMLVSLFAFPTSAAELPAPYADLAFKADGTVYDATGNTDCAFYTTGGNGFVGPMDVTLDDGRVYNTWAVRAVEAFDIIEFYFPDFASPEDYEAFVAKGITLEIYAAYDNHVEKTCGIFGSNKGTGGMGIILRGRAAGAYEDALTPSHQIMYQIGIKPDETAYNALLEAGGWSNNKYVYVGDNKLGSGNVTDTELLDEHLGKLVHLAATYDPDKKEIRLYYNGVLVQTGPMGDFVPNANSTGFEYSVMTVGHNASATGESMVEKSPMTTVEARIYNCSLNDTQVFDAYTKCVEDVVNGANVPAGAGDATTEAPTDVTEAPADVTEAPADVTEAPADVTEAPADDVTEAPADDVTEAPADDVTKAPADDTKAPAGDKGCGGVIGVGAIVALLGAAVVLKKRD